MNLSGAEVGRDQRQGRFDRSRWSHELDADRGEPDEESAGLEHLLMGGLVRRTPTAIVR